MLLRRQVSTFLLPIMWPRHKPNHVPFSQVYQSVFKDCYGLCHSVWPLYDSDHTVFNTWKQLCPRTNFDLGPTLFSDQLCSRTNFGLWPTWSSMFACTYTHTLYLSSSLWINRRIEEGESKLEILHLPKLSFLPGWQCLGPRVKMI